MQAIIPQKLKIKNDSVPENDAPAWNANTEYPVGTKTMDDHKVYQALSEGNKGKRPSLLENSEGADAPWIFLDATNKYKCIDAYNYSQTVAPEGATELVIQVPFDRPANALGLLNMSAASVTITLTATTLNSEGKEVTEIVWESGTVDLLRDSSDWWDYCFGGYRQQRDKVFTAIPPVTGTLTITLSGGRPAIGNILVGEHVIFGTSEYGIRTGFVSYSNVTTDNFGRVTRTKRRSAKRGSFPVFVDEADLDAVQQILEDLDGDPALWIGDNGTGHQSMIIYGDLKEYEGSLDSYGAGKANFEIRGVI
jgi:hypothetical protein